jgi:hypothetical protein
MNELGVQGRTAPTRTDLSRRDARDVIRPGLPRVSPCAHAAYPMQGAFGAMQACPYTCGARGLEPLTLTV